MQVREHGTLRDITTFKVGASVRYIIPVTSVPELEEALAFASEKNLPLAVLGEGSNILPTDDPYEGVIVLMQEKGIRMEVQDGTVLVSAYAGESWDAFVTFTVNEGLWGIENLAGIPGTVGAAPVQNIGAYGADISQVLECAHVYDVRTRKSSTFTKKMMELSYRDSVFKRTPELIVLEVTLRLTREGAPRIGYPDLRRAEEEGIALTTPTEIAEAVRAIRSKKFPDLSVFGTAGSFFKNPVVSSEAFAALSEKFGALPSFPQNDQVKIPLAFILDKLLALKGYEKGNVFLYGNQPLVIVAKPGASAQEIDALVQEIEEKVFLLTGIRIEREVRKISEHEIKNCK